MIIELKKGKYLKVANSIREYEKLVQYRLMSFEKIKDECNEIDNVLEITPKCTKIKILGKEYVINKKLAQTDLYTIIHAMISIILSDENNAFIHSSIVSKKNKGVLLLSNFGLGKTALALEMEKMGFDINSADHAHLCIEGDRVFMKRGSSYVKYEDNLGFLEKDKVTSNVEIKEIVLLYGLCDDGIYKQKIIIDKNRKIKMLFPFLTWWVNCPLITDPNIILENPKFKEMFDFLINLTRINEKFYILRGDKRKISLELSCEIDK